jgi:hypothetical protein
VGVCVVVVIPSPPTPPPPPHLFVANAEVALRLGVALVGGLGEPRRGRRFVLRNALAVVEANAEVALRVRVALATGRIERGARSAKAAAADKSGGVGKGVGVHS